MDEAAPFRTFRTPEEAQALASDLELLGFAPIIEDSRNYISSAFVGASPEYFSVKLPSSDFPRAEAALEEVAEKQLNEVGDDHYLFGFTNEELRDVVMKADEWNAFDRRLARKILADLGEPVNEAAIPHFEQARLSELAEPAKPQTLRVIVGYVLAVLGGLLGVFIGHHLNTAKKTLPNGERVYVYNAEDRSHGKWIFFIGIVMFLFVIYRFLSGLGSRTTGAP